MKAVLRRARVTLLALTVLCIVQLLKLNAPSRRKHLSKTPHVLLIGAYGNGNFGDDIIGQAVADGVKRLGGSVLIAARLDDISRLSTAVADTVIVGGGVRSLLRTWRLAHGRDIAILGGGGLLEGRPDDVNVHRLILEYLGKLAVCGLRGQRIAIHGIGVSPNLYSSALVNKAASEMLKIVDVIGVRDPSSEGTVKQFNARVSLIQDPAIVLFQSWARQAQRQANTTAVVLLDHHRWPTFAVGSSEQEGKRTADLTTIARELVKRSDQGELIRLLAFHWSDVNICQDLFRLFLEHGGRQANIEIEPYTQATSEGPFKLLMSCENVLTMRFHPALAALTANAKVEVIGSLQKLEQLRRSTAGRNEFWKYPEEYGDPVEQLKRIIWGEQTVQEQMIQPHSPSSL